MTTKHTAPPPGYTTNLGGASAEGDHPGGEGWFYIPSEMPTRFHETEQECIEAAWDEYRMVERRKAIFAAGAQASDPEPIYEGNRLGSMERFTFYDGYASTHPGFHNPYRRQQT